MDADPDFVATLLALEQELLRPEVRASRAALEALLAAEFIEIGSSGRVYDREGIIGAIAGEAPGDRAVARIEAFGVRSLAPGIALATYRTVDDGPGGAAGARRSSIWRRDADGAWRMTFHQGTPSG
jgi:hypothetical protein